jgi:hypothetical protein
MAQVPVPERLEKPDTPEKDILQLVDMIVAQVDKRVLSLSEVLAETRLVLLRQGGPIRARKAEVRRPLFLAVLRSMVARTLLLNEAGRLNLSPLPPGDLRREMSAIRARFSTRGDYVRFLERFGFTVGADALLSAAAPIPPLLLDIIEAELEVERFVSLRIHRSIVVSEDEIRACFLSQIDVFQGQALDAVRGRIEESIRVSRSEQRLIRLLGQLQRKAKIRFAKNYQLKGSLLDVKHADQTLGLHCPEAN